VGTQEVPDSRWSQTDELLTQARSAITRTFTEEECTLYGIDPCPTLEQIQDT
jgi:hypothetical protein